MMMPRLLICHCCRQLQPLFRFLLLISPPRYAATPLRYAAAFSFRLLLLLIFDY